MLYSIVGIDNADSLAARMAVRNEHVARLKDLLAQGRLIIAGPVNTRGRPGQRPV